ncbi:MAG TPA: hypothetical protein VM098_04650 [Phycisphaerae bacterium]|nr:hypothetical protein [Phycisphaerae bacterium]
MATEIRRVLTRRREPGEVVKPLSRAVRCYCLECCGYQPSEVAVCSSHGCHLWPYRMGRGVDAVLATESEAGKVPE